MTLKRSNLIIRSLHFFLLNAFGNWILWPDSNEHVVECMDRASDILRCILQAIYPLHIFNLFSYSQLGLISLLPSSIAFPHLIEKTLFWNHYLQTSFWQIMLPSIMQHKKSDEYLLAALESLSKWKSEYEMKGLSQTQKVATKKPGKEMKDLCVWMTYPYHTALHSWVHSSTVLKSKRIEAIYDLLLTFPIRDSCYLFKQDKVATEPRSQHKEETNRKRVLSDMIDTDTTHAFKFHDLDSASFSPFDDFHIQLLLSMLCRQFS
ncbi:hypothetical protein RFI_17409, partial [Reticulomyxa filosa]